MVLVPFPDTNISGRDSNLLCTYSYSNTLGQSVSSPLCSEGCITGYPRTSSDPCCQLLEFVFVMQSSYPPKNFCLLRSAEPRVLKFRIHDDLLDYYFFRLLDTIDGRLIHVGDH